jgi:3-isopropylmalate/(R)-2-methylmalate dehydratase small subunit
MKLQGRVWKFGDNVDTDLIIPARFLNSFDRDELAQNCFADVRPGFMDLISPGDIIVAGKNFGSGSSREHAPLAIKAAGISVIIAESFARIFYRNAFNIGLPILESVEAASSLQEGCRVSIDLATGQIVNVDAGGLVNHIKKIGMA